MTSSTSRPAHMLFLDGIRGLAAFYVVLFHILQWSYTFYRGERFPAWFRLVQVLKYGPLAVGVFIVLSGYCLMLPVARSGNGHLTRGFGEFIKRRARRILPPYYAAFVLSLLLLLLPSMQTIGIGPSEYHMYDRVSMPGAILSHLALVHNLSNDWIFRVDSPLWSVATEWQIYFLFPLLLLPLWRKFGMIAPIAVGFLLGLATIPLGVRFAGFWYLGLFAMGMAGAMISTSPSVSETLKRLRWDVLGVVFALASLCASTKLPANYVPAVDLLMGLGAMCLLIHYANRVRGATSSWGLRLLSSPVVVWLGSLSYSLYLIHYPLIALEQILLNRYHLNTVNDFLILLVVGLPAIMALTYLFHIIFERPFLNYPSKPVAAPSK